MGYPYPMFPPYPSEFQRCTHESSHWIWICLCFWYLKNDSRNDAKVAPILSQNGDPNAANVGESMKTREKENSRKDKRKNHEKDDKQIPSKAWFWSSLLHGSTVFTFRPLLQKVFKMVSKSTRNGDPESPLTETVGRRDVYKACSHMQSNKLLNASQMGAQMGGPQSDFFNFWGLQPTMGSRASLDRLQGPDRCKNGTS